MLASLQRKGGIMTKLNEAMEFMLPDILGKPDFVTDKKGNLIGYGDIPPDCYAFFIPIFKWKSIKKVPKLESEL